MKVVYHILMLLSYNDIKRFWKKVKINLKTHCWEWKGTITNYGYGQIYIQGKLYLAHRISFLLDTKNLPEVCILHKCDNPMCVNPKHLFKGTQSDNNKDAAQKGRSARLCGIKNPNAKLTEDNLNEIKSWFSIGISRSQVAKAFKISWTHANTLKQRLTKK